MQFQEIIAAVKQQGGFDVDDATVGGWVNQLHQEAVSAAQWQMATISLATTVANVDAYPVPVNVADVVSVYIDAGEGPADYQRVGTTDMWALRGGRRGLRGSGGVFAPSFDADGVAQIELYPVPDTSGQAVMALVALIPSDMSGSMVPVIPPDMHGRLIEGAIAIGLMRIDERPDAASIFQSRFSEMVAELRRRKNSRIGSEPTRIAVEGYDF